MVDSDALEQRDAATLGAADGRVEIKQQRVGGASAVPGLPLRRRKCRRGVADAGTRTVRRTDSVARVT